MGKFEDYITSLEGRDDVSVEIVAELAKFHNEDLSTSSAKIEQLNSQLSEKDTAIAAKDSELNAAKAANWDLVNQIPAPENEIPDATGDGEIDQKRITLDDAFAQ